MGTAASVIPDIVPEEIRNMYALTERQKLRVAEIDNTMLEAEMGKMFKGHNKIIDELTGRSKQQLRLLLDKFPQSNRHLEALNTSGNQYAKFIQHLAMTKSELEMDSIKSGQEYDEELLINIIATSTVKELQKLDELFIAEKSFGVADFFATRGKGDSTLTKLVQRIFRFDRNETKDIDVERADELMESIHKAGAARLLGVDDDTIIEILVKTSRAQCFAISEAYQKKYKMKLERALNMKFKGNASKLLVSWSLPMPSAIVNCINYIMQRILPDKSSICRFVARFDKDTLKLADMACKDLHQKSLSDFLSTAVSGNVFRALKGWIEQPSPDKGFQKIMDVYIDSKIQEGYSMEEIYTNAELLAKLQFLLEKMAAEMKLFLIDHNVKIDASDHEIMAKSQASIMGLNKAISSIRLAQQASSSALLTKSSSTVRDEENKTKTPKTPKPFDYDLPEVTEEDEEADFAQAASVKELLAQRKFSVMLPNNIQRDFHDKMVNHTYAYLLTVFEDADIDAEGSFEESMFWDVVRGLPLKLFGFVPRDIDLIRAGAAWTMDDGRVYYYEALLEFAESVVTSIENKEDGDEEDGGRDVIAIIDRLVREKEDAEANEDQVGADLNFDIDRVKYALASSSRRTTSAKFSRIPLYFRQYVYDTVAAFDLDCAGTLTNEDLTKLLELLQVPSAILQSQSFYSAAVEGVKPGMEGAMKYDLKTCADLIFRQINPWFGDGQDHYICLMDKSSGAYFWFNTRDESSQWVEASAEEAFPHHEDHHETIPHHEDEAKESFISAESEAKHSPRAGEHDEDKEAPQSAREYAESKGTEQNGNVSPRPTSSASMKGRSLSTAGDDTKGETDEDLQPPLMRSQTAPTQLETAIESSGKEDSKKMSSKLVEASQSNPELSSLKNDPQVEETKNSGAGDE